MCLCILDIRGGLAGGQSMLGTCTQGVYLYVMGRDCLEKELVDLGSSMTLPQPQNDGCGASVTVLYASTCTDGLQPPAISTLCGRR